MLGFIGPEPGEFDDDDGEWDECPPWLRKLFLRLAGGLLILAAAFAAVRWL